MDNRNRRGPNGLFRGNKVGRAIKVTYAFGVILGIVISAYYGGI